MEEVIQNEFRDDSGKRVKPMIVFRATSGRFKRMLQRAQTVHKEGVCPNCGGRLRWRKDIYKGKGEYEHNKWVCSKCNNIYAKEANK